MQTNWTADEFVRSEQAPTRRWSDLVKRASRKLLIALVLFIVAAVGLLAAVRTIPVVFESTATLAVTPRAGTPAGSEQAIEARSTSVDAVVTALNAPEMEKRLAAEVLRRAKTDPALAAAEGVPAALDVNAERRPGTYLVDITARADTAVRARAIAQAAIEVYQGAQLEQLAAAPASSAPASPANTDAIQASRKKLADLQAEKNRLQAVPAASAPVAAAESRELVAARAELSGLRASSNDLSIFLTPGEAQTDVATFRASGALDRLGERGAGLAAMINDFVTLDPAATNAGERDRIHDRILAEAVRLFTVIEGEARSLSARIAQMPRAVANAPAAPQNTAAIATLDSQLAAERVVLDQLMAAGATAAPQPGTALTTRIVAEASHGEPPLLSRHDYFDILAVAAAFLIAVLFVLISALWSDTVLEVRDVASLAGAPSMATTPRIPGWKLRRLPPGERLPSNYALEHPTSPFNDAVREVLVMMRRPANTGSICIVVAGSQKGDGATTLALSLGRTASATGQRVLLIDADLDEAGLTKAMNIDPNSGIEALLDKGMQLPDLVVEDALSGVHLLPSSPSRSASGALSLTKLNAFKSALATARMAYDIIIIDSHPQGARSRSWSLSRMADAALVVTAHNASSRAQVRGLARRLRQGGARVRGVVMNFSPERSQRSRVTFQLRSTDEQFLDETGAEAPSSEVIELRTAR